MAGDGPRYARYGLPTLRMGSEFLPGFSRHTFLDWYSGVNDTALLNIIDTNLASIGNDFALDDISLVAASVPEPASFLLFGSAVLVAARALRRKLAL